MSQRLHIGETKDTIYDCIVTDEHNLFQKLLNEFFCFKSNIFWGPWKIRIGNIELFKEIYAILSEAFVFLGKQFPNDVWFFYKDDRSIEHPTEEALFQWLK